MNNNIFQRMSQQADQDKFAPLLEQDVPSAFSGLNQDPNEPKKNIFFEMAQEKPPQDNFGFLDTVKDVAQQIATKTVQGASGAYGNILGAVGLGTKENLLPGHKAALEASYENDFDLGLDDDILPRYSRLPTSEDTKKIIQESTGIGEGKTAAGRIAGRAAEFVGEGLPFPGGGAKGLLSLGGAGVAGQTVRELGGPEALATGVEITGSILPSLIQGKVNPRGGEAKRITDAGRALGLTEKQIAPLIQSEGKATLLSKVARKGQRTKEAFASIKDSLGNIMDNISQRASQYGSLNYADTQNLVSKFTNIRNNLSKTIKASPDKEAAINFIEDVIKNIQNNGTTPEKLINGWRDINKTVRWNSLQGGKKALAQLKEPILEALQKTSPQLAKDFEMGNELYSKYSKIARKLKPDIVDSFLNKGEITAAVPAAFALVQGNVAPFAALAGESALRILSREMLINPYFQNLGNKLVTNFNQGSLKAVTDLMKNAKEFMDRKHPEENWDFLLED